MAQKTLFKKTIKGKQSRKTINYASITFSGSAGSLFSKSIYYFYNFVKWKKTGFPRRGSSRFHGRPWGRGETGRDQAHACSARSPVRWAGAGPWGEAGKHGPLSEEARVPRRSPIISDQICVCSYWGGGRKLTGAHGASRRRGARRPAAARGRVLASRPISVAAVCFKCILFPETSL